MREAMNTGLITTCVLVTVACSEAKANSKDGKMNMRPVIGGFALGLLLFASDEVAPSLTKYMAILILVAALATNGTYLLNLFPKG